MSGKARRTIWQDGVEPEFWNQLRLIAMEYQTSTAKLITEIDRISRLLPLRQLLRVVAGQCQVERLAARFLSSVT